MRRQCSDFSQRTNEKKFEYDNKTVLEPGGLGKPEITGMTGKPRPINEV